MQVSKMETGYKKMLKRREEREYEAYLRGVASGKKRTEDRAARASTWAHTNVMGGGASFKSGGFKGYGIEIEGITAGASGVLGTQSYMGADEPASMVLPPYDVGEGGEEPMEVVKFQGGTEGEGTVRPTIVVSPISPMGRESSTGGAFSGLTTNISPELKFFDTHIVVVTIPTSGGIVFTSLNRIPQGITESTRIGRKCTIMKLNLRFSLTYTPGTTSSLRGQVARIIVYQDRQTNGADAVVLDFLETSKTESFRNLANTRRFHTIHDESYTFNRLTLATKFDANAWVSAQVNQWIEVNKSVNIPLEFDGATGAITELCTNNIGMIGVLHDSFDEGETNFHGTIRVRYTDM